MSSPLISPSVLLGRKCSPHLARQESKARKDEVTLLWTLTVAEYRRGIRTPAGLWKEEKGHWRLGMWLLSPPWGQHLFMGCCVALSQVSSQNIRHTNIQPSVQNTFQSQIKMTSDYSFPFCEKSRLFHKSLKKHCLHPASRPSVLPEQNSLVVF